MASADPAELDARVRSLERAAAARIGRTTTEHTVRTAAGVRVRVVEFAAEFLGDDSPPSGSAPTGSPPTGSPTTGSPTTGSPRTGSRPPIVLMHGIAAVTAVSLPIVAALTGRRILAVDWPGHGLSGAAVLPKDAELRDHMNSVLEAVVTQLELERVDLIGHSLGGHAALAFALRHPEQVRRLVLLGAPGAAFDGASAPLGMRLAAIPGVGTALLGLSTSESATRRGFARTLGAPAVAAMPADAIEIAHLCSQRPQFAASVASLFRAMMTPFAARPGVALTSAELASLEPPTVLVLGDADVILTSAAAATSMAAIRAGHTLNVSGGHAPWLDDPSVGPAVAAFLGGRD